MSSPLDTSSTASPRPSVGKRKISNKASSSPATRKRASLWQQTNYFQAMIDNPNPQHSAAPTSSLQGANGDRMVVVMVGLPATGKTHVARRLKQYLSFFHGAVCEVFNVGNYRRKIVGAKTPHTFFDASNPDFLAQRNEIAVKCLDDLKGWLFSSSPATSPTSGAQQRSPKKSSPRKASGRIAIYDATNSTRERRRWLLKELTPMLESKRHIVFVESVVTENSIIENNVRAVKLKMPDYEGVSEDKAVRDFRSRIEHYADVYEPLEAKYDRKLSYITIVDAGVQITMNRIAGYLQGRLVQFLTHLHTLARPIYLSRHGQSEYNRLEKIGGDSELSPMGREYASRLAKWAHTELLGLTEDGKFLPETHERLRCEESCKTCYSDYSNCSCTYNLANAKKDGIIRMCPRVRLMTSSLRRTQETAAQIAHPVCDDGWIVMRPRAWRNLDEIYAGLFDGMTYEEIKEFAPDQFSERAKDKLTYRYPRGESYLDVIERLDPIIHEVERQRDPMLIVGHQGILRILYAYFKGMPREQAPFVRIPLNTVIKIVPGTYECDESRFQLLSASEVSEFKDSASFGDSH